MVHAQATSVQETVTTGRVLQRCYGMLEALDEFLSSSAENATYSKLAA